MPSDHEVRQYDSARAITVEIIAAERAGDKKALARLESTHAHIFHLLLGAIDGARAAYVVGG